MAAAPQPTPAMAGGPGRGRLESSILYTQTHIIAVATCITKTTVTRDSRRTQAVDTSLSF